MQYLTIALPLAALVSGTVANPFKAPACADNACLAAVTGKAALGDDNLRKGHCVSFLHTTVTPLPIIVTETITGDGNHGLWPRATVAVCPNEVPNYASACNEAAYTSACSCWGFTEVKTTTVAPSTTTKTIWVKPTGGPVVVSGTTCPAAVTSTTTVYGGGHGDVTKTITVTTATPTTTTVTKCGTSAAAAASTSQCVVDGPKATALANNFMDLLQHTNFPGAPGIPKGSGYHQEISDATLSKDFSDVSDSINFMAGIPLGSVTFPTKGAFDQGQGGGQPEVAIEALNIWHSCSSVTFRWRIFSTRYPVTGINHMIIGSDGKILKNYAEFDNAAWLESFGMNCSTNPTQFVPVKSGSPVLKARHASNHLKIDA